MVTAPAPAAPFHAQRGLTSLDPRDPRRLRIVREGHPTSVWALGLQRKLFFVTGHARSGTTWAASILMRHPRVFVDGEFHFQQLRDHLDAFAAHPHHRGSREPVLSAVQECFHDTIRLCVGASAHQKPEADWIGDRTPRPLKVLLPGTPHIVIIRDGRDVTVSLAIMELNTGGGVYSRCADDPKLRQIREKFLADPEFFKQHPTELLTSEPFVRTIARRWGQQATHDLAEVKRIRREEGDGTTAHIVYYEHLHTNPEGEREAMYRFLGVNTADAEPLTAESGTKPGLQTDNHRSDKRKGIVGDWMNYFTDQAKAWFKEEAGEVLRALDYEPDGNW